MCCCINCKKKSHFTLFISTFQSLYFYSTWVKEINQYLIFTRELFFYEFKYPYFYLSTEWESFCHRCRLLIVRSWWDSNVYFLSHWSDCFSLIPAEPTQPAFRDQAKTTTVLLQSHFATSQWRGVATESGQSPAVGLASFICCTGEKLGSFVDVWLASTLEEVSVMSRCVYMLLVGPLQTCK